MELGLRLGEAMADAGRELVLGLGVGVRADEEGGGGKEAAAAGRNGMEAAEPAVRLSLLPLVPNLGLAWPSESRRLEASTRGFDVNQTAAEGAEEEDDEVQGDAAAAAVSSSPNDSAGSFPLDLSVHGRGITEAAARAGAERASSRASDDDEGGSARKKLRLSKEQSAFLEESFKEHSTLNPKQKLALAKQLNLRPRQVEVWFQNRRARTKLKQTEVDCEYLKRCCETLTEENRRLQKELAELRALKTAHPFYMHLPATTLSMCPSCERVASNSSSASAAASAPAKATAGSVATAADAPREQRPTSFAALFTTPRVFPLTAQQRAQPPASL